MFFFRTIQQAQQQKEILSCLAAGIRHGSAYSAAVRNFCIGLQNSSPAGYRFVRKAFDNRIPSPITMRAWYANSDVSCAPGIIKYSLDVLKRMVDEMQVDGKKLVGCLLFDEMSIHKMLQFVNNQMVGFETIPNIDKKNAKIASQALVFMLSCVNEVRLPIAYYFINSLNSTEKALIASDVIKKVIECGVELVGVTFDGFRANPAMCEILGAKLNVLDSSFDPSFTINGHKIHIIFDPSHCIKLVRGSLSNKGVLYNSENKPIKWEYFKQLMKFNTNRNFAGPIHKLTKSHIDWHSNEMNVRLAVETLSGTTANAFEFLMNEGHSQFIGAEYTIQFTRIMNDAFDISNSTHKSLAKANVLKRPWNVENIGQIHEMRVKIIQYLKGLQFRNDKGKLMPLCTSMVKTGFQGFVINMNSFSKIYSDLVETKKLLHYLTIHTLSQDHLEQFFGDMRSLNGSNNNPNAVQFCGGLRKILANTTICQSKKRNCTVLSENSIYNPYSNILTITSRRPNSMALEVNLNINEDDIQPILTELGAIQASNRTNSLIDLSDLTTAQIAHDIELQIERKIQCELCKDVFAQNDKVHRAFHSDKITRKACQSTFDICKTTDYFMKLEILKGQFTPELIQQAIHFSLEALNLYEKTCFNDHNGNNDQDHKTVIINYVLCSFIKIKGHHIAKTVSFKEHNEQMRKKLSKLILNYGQ